MSPQLLTTGRVRQKQETRTRILETAQRLLQTQTTFSLEDVAREMAISRATIYRYYSSVDLLCAEAFLSFRVKQPADFVADVQRMTLADALLYVQDYFNHLTKLHEPGYRKYMSVVLAESVKADSARQLRGGRRPAALEAVLQLHAAQLTPEQHERLRQITTVLCGIEPLIANRDVNGLSSDESQQLLHWALRMILQGMTLAEPLPEAPDHRF